MKTQILIAALCISASAVPAFANKAPVPGYSCTYKAEHAADTPASQGSCMKDEMSDDLDAMASLVDLKERLNFDFQNGYIPEKIYKGRSSELNEIIRKMGQAGDVRKKKKKEKEA